MRDKRIRRLRPRGRAFLQMLRGERRLTVSRSEADALRAAIDVLLPNAWRDGSSRWGAGAMSDVRRIRWRADCLAALLDDLGWPGSKSYEAVITVPPDRLLTALDVISDYCAELLEHERGELSEAAAKEQRYRAGLLACTGLRRQIDVKIVPRLRR